MSGDWDLSWVEDINYGPGIDSNVSSEPSLLSNSQDIPERSVIFSPGEPFEYIDPQFFHTGSYTAATGSLSSTLDHNFYLPPCPPQSIQPTNEVPPWYLRNSIPGNDMGPPDKGPPQGHNQPPRATGRKRPAPEVSDDSATEGGPRPQEKRPPHPKCLETNPEITLQAHKMLQCWLEIYFDPDQLESDLPSKKDIENIAKVCNIPAQVVKRWLKQRMMQTQLETPATPNRAGIVRAPATPPPTLPHGIYPRQEFPPAGPSSQPLTQPLPEDPGQTSPTRFTDQLKRELTEAYLNGRKKPCDPGQRKSNKDGDYQCLWKCGYRSKTVDGWERHLENRQPQTLWICKICRDNGSSGDISMTHRKDKMRSHITSIHVNHNEVTEDDVETIRRQSKVRFRAPFNQKCGFCRKKFPSWKERNKHIVGHFKGEDPTDHGQKRDVFQDWDEHWKEEHNQRRYSWYGGDDDSDDDESDDNDNHDGSNGNNRGLSGHDRHDRGHGPGGGPASFGQGPSGPGEGSSGGTGSSGQYSSSGPSPTHSFPSGYYYGQQNCYNKLLGCPLRTVGMLGRGSHAIVEEIQLNGKRLARKRFPATDGKAPAQFQKELSVMTKLKNPRHPNIIGLEGAYQDGSFNLLISPVAQSDLQKHFHTPVQHRQGTEQLLTWVKDLASAMAHLHDKRIRHADIKPSNILVQGSQLLMGDFSISRELSDSASSSSSHSPMTPLYAPPEIALSKRHGRKADVFSLGCVYLELITFSLLGTLGGLYAYLGISSPSKKQCTTYQTSLPLAINWIAALRQRSNESCLSSLGLCESMIQYDPINRPTAVQVYQVSIMALSPLSIQMPVRGKCGAVESIAVPSGVGVRISRLECKLKCCSMPLRNDKVTVERQSKAGPIKKKFRQDSRACSSDWPYNELPEPNKLSPRCQRDEDLLGLGLGTSSSDWLMVDAPPSYGDYVLNKALDIDEEVVFAKVLQQDDGYGELPNERFFREMKSDPPFLPTQQSFNGNASQPCKYPADYFTTPSDTCSAGSTRYSPWRATSSSHRARPKVDVYLPWSASRTDRKNSPGGTTSPTITRGISASVLTAVPASSSGHTYPALTPVSSTFRASRFVGKDPPDTDASPVDDRHHPRPFPVHSAPPSSAAETGSAQPSLRSRGSSTSLRSACSDFKRCGRHSNQWLFHDLSIRATAKSTLNRARARAFKRRRIM